MPDTTPWGFSPYSLAPSTPSQKLWTGDLVAGSRIREYEYAKSWARTGSPFENVMPSRILIV